MIGDRDIGPTVEGWTLIVDWVDDSDGFEAPDYYARHEDGRQTKLDVSRFSAGMTDARFAKMVALGFPTRATIGSPAPLRAEHIEQLYRQFAAEFLSPPVPTAPTGGNDGGGHEVTKRAPRAHSLSRRAGSGRPVIGHVPFQWKGAA